MLRVWFSIDILRHVVHDVCMRVRDVREPSSPADVIHSLDFHRTITTVSLHVCLFKPFGKRQAREHQASPHRPQREKSYPVVPQVAQCDVQDNLEALSAAAKTG